MPDFGRVAVFHSSYRISIASIGVVFLVGLIPWSLLESIPASTYWMVTVEMLFVWSVIAYSGVRLSFIMASGRKTLITLTLFIYAYLFMGVAPLLQVASGDFPLPGSYSGDRIVYGCVLILSGLMAFDAGALFMRKDLLLIALLKKRVFGRTVNRKILLAGTVIAMMLAGGAIVYQGGIDQLFVSRLERGSTIYTSVEGAGKSAGLVMESLLRVPVFVAFIGLLLFWIHQKRQRLAVPLWLWLLLPLLALLVLLVSNPISTPRYWFGTVIVGTVFAVMRWRRYSAALLVFSFIAALIFVFPLADVYRNSADVDLASSMEGVVLYEEIAENGDFDSFQQFLNAIDLTDTEDYQYGRQMLGTLLFWVPRSKWGGKPIPSGSVVAEYVGYRNSNLSMPLWGELYIDGGVLLMLLGFFYYGAFARQLERMSTIREDGMAPSFLMVFVPIFSAYQLFLLRGSLMSAFAYLVPVFLFVLLVTSENRRKQARRLSENGRGLG